MIKTKDKKNRMKGVTLLAALLMGSTISGCADDSTIKQEKVVVSRTQFVLDCYARVDKGGDPSVFDECFTKDFKMTGPETRMISSEPDGSLRGKQALEFMGKLNRVDDASFEKKDWDLILKLEAGNKVIRRMQWTGTAPKGSYAGFENISNDIIITGDAVLVDTFRGDKIAEQFFAYDTMSFFMDLAEGDMKKVAKALRNMDVQMQAMKKAQAEGKPIPVETINQ